MLAYGPLALGKGQHCPRDGRLDCSIVDALEATSCLGSAEKPAAFLSLECAEKAESNADFS